MDTNNGAPDVSTLMLTGMHPYTSLVRMTADMRKPIALVDISHIFRSKMHASGDLPISHAADDTVKLLHTIAAKNYLSVACCFDMKPYKRNIMFPEYKANREKEDIAVQEQYRRLIKTVRDQGFVAWGVEGYEADDIIATAVRQCKVAEVPVDIYTNDKDLMQLVSDEDQVRLVSTMTGAVFDCAAVFDKFGVAPDSIVEFLALMGDKSDNIPGVPGCGAVTAAALINKFGSVAEVIRAAENGLVSRESGIRGAAKIEAAIMESRLALQHGVLLIELWSDADIEFAEIFEERKVVVDRFEDDEREAIQNEPRLVADGQFDVSRNQPAPVHGPPLPVVPMHKNGTSVPEPVAKKESSTMDAIELRPGVYLTKEKAALVRRMAEEFYASGLYKNKFLNVQSIFTVLIQGMELGVGHTTALNLFHVIEGKLSPASHFLISLAKRDSDCEYLECESESEGSVTYVCKKRSYPKEQRFTYSMNDAKNDNLRWANNKKNQRAMLRKTAGCQAARLWFPDATCGMYSPSELGMNEEND